MEITIDQARQIMPQARTQLLEQFLDKLNELLPLYNIDKPLRAAAFIAQGAHESGELRELVENMYYSTPERLMTVWPKRFPSRESAIPYIKNPEKLGNFVYANRMGNGNPSTGDGFRYRGRGWFNGTGKEFYTKMTTISGHGFVAHPDDMADPQFAVLSACEEWKASNLNKLADAQDFKQITKIINGGFIGLSSRMIYYAKARKAFGVDK
jgi:putative chitinase